MFKYLTEKWKQKRGFTLMEVMVVVAILAVIAGIAIPSVINMRKNMKFKERNDYAKAIFMAAQANLTEMRSKGELDLLQAQADLDSLTATAGAPTGYTYTYNAMQSSYALVLPANSIDSTIRNEQVIIEYNPKAGIIYSVFYYEGNSDELHGMYTTPNKISRSSEDARKELLVGYYSVGDVDALDAKALKVRQVSSSLSYINAQEGIVTVTIPILDTKYNNIFANTDNDNPTEETTPSVSNNDYSRLINGLEITLIIVGENGGTFPVTFSGSDAACISYFKHDISNFAVTASFPLDSLEANGSFTKIVTNKNDAGGNVITPGDNVTITAEVTYIPSAVDPIIMIESSTIAGINPLYHSLTQNPVEGGRPYILAISNARHLQNLQHLDGAFADANIESIVFVAQTEEDTVTNSGASNPEDPSTPSSDPAEPSVASAITRTAADTSEKEENDSSEPSTPEENTEIVIDWAGNGTFDPITFSADYEHPKIIGNGVKISNLQITKGENGNTGASIGLFAELKNASVEGITLVDPVIINNSVFLSGSATPSAATTGALIGTATNVTVDNCHIIKETDRASISGKQLVGGLVGFVNESQSTTSSFTNCSVDDIPVVDLAKNPQQNDQIPYILGGLVGYVNGNATNPVAFKDCTTTATVTATTATDLGGMAGIAVNAKFEGCSTEATVTGADGVLSNIGGLVGSTTNVAFSDCDADCTESGKDGAIILSSTNAGGNDNKQKVGGLVGFATGGKFTNCTSNTGTKVTSAANAVSDVGGMVGYADDVEFTGCKSYANVTATQWVDSKVTIPKNNIGGLVGHAADTVFTNAQINMSKLPEYAETAGGLAGSISNCELKDITVEWDLGNDSGLTTNNITISYFGGIAGASVNTNTNTDTPMSNVIVRIMDKVGSNAENSAGAFAATQGCKLNDVAVVTEEYGTISGTKAAGVVGTNGSHSNIQYSYFIGNLSGSSNAGFVYNNAHGVVQRCMADITAENTFGFFASNATTSKDTSGKVDVIAQGTIQDCYAWTKTSDHDDPGSYYYGNLISTYFVNNSDSSVVLIDASGNYSEQIYYTLTLKTDVALNALNGSDGTPWVISSDGYPYPRIKDLACPNNYKSPAGNYPFGVLYIEEYSEEYSGEKGIGIYEMAYNVGNDYKPVNTLKNATITSTRYELYCITDAASSIKLGDPKAYNSYDDLKTLNEFYSIYPIDSSGAEDFEVGGIEASVNTYYGPVNNNGAYRIRTAAQFGNIGSSGDYAVEFPLTLETDGAIESFSGSISGSVAIDASAISGNLVGTLKGTLSRLTVTGLKAPMVNEISGGTVTGCDVSGKIESGENVGIIAGTMSSGSIENSNVSGSVRGSGYVGGVVGRSAGKLTNVIATMEFVTSSNSEKTGALVGYASTGTIQNCSATILSDTIPPFVTLTPKAAIDEEAMYFSRTNHIPSNSDDNTTRLYLGNSLIWAPIAEANFATYSSDVTISGCKLNNSSVPVGFVYYYKIDENLQCSNPSHAMDFIVMEERDPQFEDVAAGESQYYVHISDDIYKAIGDVHIKERTVTIGEGEDKKEDTVYDFYYTVEGEDTETIIKDISKSSKVSSAKLKLYKKYAHSPDERTYMVFDAQGNQILIHNENGYQWQDYTTNYYAHMIWKYNDKDGVLTNMYKPDNAESGTITVGEAAGLITVTLKYNGTEKVCRLYPVDAYRTVELVDSAIVLDTSVLTK